MSIRAIFSDRCFVAPSPQLRKKMARQLKSLRTRAGGALASKMRMTDLRYPGLNDGLIIPGDQFPLGAPLAEVRSAALRRAPLRAKVRVIVVLVDFSDKRMTRTADSFRRLFFSRGELANGSVREYYDEVSNGKIDIDGEVVGPYRMPRTLAYYANGNSGESATGPSARQMALDAAKAANKDVNFRPYDNDGNGYVDAFIVIHAGKGAETTNSPRDIWSHKWVLPTEPYPADSVKIYAYLTVPEDCKIGVCAHEIGHLLFGWPDLYDTDYSSSGLGDWCLMAGGSWNGTGDIPAHPSAWCKANQGWVSVVNQRTNATVRIGDVKNTKTVYRLWRRGSGGLEYFLVENRQRSRFDRRLPGDGLLVYHIDESIDSNDYERHYMVGLVQADGLRQLEQGVSEGDTGDPFPGSSRNRSLTPTSDPSSESYARANTGVSVTNISASGNVMTARFTVQSAPSPASKRRSPRGKPGTRRAAARRK